MNDQVTDPKKLMIVRLKDKELVDVLCQRARLAVLAWLRGRSSHVFWNNGKSVDFSYYDFGRFIGIARGEKLDLPSVATVLAHHSPIRFRTFEVNWLHKDGGYPGLRVSLVDPSEWTDVMSEAWEGLDRPPYNLSEPAGSLLVWAQKADRQKVWIDRATIGRQAQLRGTSWTADFLANYFKEIQIKANIGLQFERKEDEFRLSFELPPPVKPVEMRHGPLNPVLPLDFKQVTFAELNRFCELVYDWILAATLPADSVSVAIWNIHDRATLFRCFPKWQSEGWSISTILNFLSQVALDYGLLWGYSFQDPQPWFYECCPKSGLTWTDIKASILKARALPPLTDRYGISAEAAALVKWFTTLRSKEWLGNLTPPVEDHLKTRIGITTGWGDKNLPVYFAMLAEEISEQTEWKVAVHPWNGGWSSTTHRLLVKRKPTAFQDVVHHIQVLGIGQGKILAKEKVEASLRALLEIS